MSIAQLSTALLFTGSCGNFDLTGLDKNRVGWTATVSLTTSKDKTKSKSLLLKTPIDAVMNAVREIFIMQATETLARSA